MTEKVLVVAFDGMDKELIEEFDLENVAQSEFGSIDNDTNISKIMTSELFAGFITGETREVHGIEGLKKVENPKNQEILNRIIPRSIVDKYRGLRTLNDILEVFFPPGEELKYKKGDLEAETLFEKIDSSLPLYVPNYNPSVHWLLGNPHKIVKYYTDDRFVNEAREVTERRIYTGTSNQPGLFEVTKDFWDFIMVHVHDPDSFQDSEIGSLREEYERLDDIAGEIKREFEGWTIIFMSDHGCPKEDKSEVWEHNENAFYSCNRELFGEKTPHITDFHDKILELTGNEEKIDS